MDNQLYHSFPRNMRKHPDCNKVGLATLEAIIKNGLILTPEVLEWKDPTPREYYPKNSPSEMKHLQLRVCFTELEESAVLEHSNEFGEFAIEWSIEEGRKLGFIPVFYVPTSTTSIGFESHGASLILRLHEVSIALGRLAKISDIPKKHDMEFLEYDQQKLSCSVGSAKELVSSMFNEKISPSTLCGFLEGTMNHFLPCGRLSDGSDELKYYRQREWRLAGFLTSRVFSDTRVINIDENQKHELLNLNKKFFGDTIEINGKPTRRVDCCGAYKIAFGKHVLEYASRVICPKVMVSEVKNRLSKANIILEVVALEDLGENTEQNDPADSSIAPRSPSG